MKKLKSVGLKTTNKVCENKKIVCRSEDQLDYSLGSYLIIRILI